MGEFLTTLDSVPIFFRMLINPFEAPERVGPFLPWHPEDRLSQARPVHLWMQAC